jgi:hypothetical protein
LLQALSNSRPPMAVHIIACVEFPATPPAGHRITKD